MNKFQILLESLLRKNEGVGYVEFKENFDSERDAKNISALSNTANLENVNHGYLLFGIDDKKNIVGTKFNHETIKVRKQPLQIWFSQVLKPFPHIEFIAEEVDSKRVVIVKVSPAIDQPIEFNGVPYVRLSEGTTSLKNHPKLQKKIWNNNRSITFEKLIATENVTTAEALSILDYSKYFSLKKIEIPTETRLFLEKMSQDKLVTINEDETYNITVLGAILFANDLSDFSIIDRKKIRVIIYEGLSKAKRKEEKEFIMGYAAGFESIVDYIMNKIGSNEEITKALRIKTTRYPEIALREFIANALIHQDLSITGTSSVIEIYPNRIEIINPGAPLIDIDRFIDHPAMSRNTDLAKMMRSLGFCEESGSGVDRALESIEVYQLPAPKFETYEIFTKVTLYAPKEFKHMSQEDRVRACYQHCTLQYVLGINRMSNSTLRKRFNIPESNYPLATKIINEAKEKGKIKVGDKPKEYIPYWA